ncbi:MAG: hypothetical protein K2H57_11000 [Duncaniella sp.]|nr:hypothetical protein [Duncaniella sp.]
MMYSIGHTRHGASVQPAYTARVRTGWQKPTIAWRINRPRRGARKPPMEI